MIIQSFIDFVIYSAIYFLGLTVGFAVLMTIWARVKGTVLEMPAKVVFGVPYFLADLLFNWTIMPLVFWPDFPEKWYEVTTTRMKRYRRTRTGRRKKFADWVCRWLNRWDPGHC